MSRRAPQRPITAALVAAAALAALPSAAAAQGFGPGGDGVGDPYFPTAGNGGYDVSHYELDLDYTPKRARIDARAAITATATQDLVALPARLQRAEGLERQRRRPARRLPRPGRRAPRHRARRDRLRGAVHDHRRLRGEGRPHQGQVGLGMDPDRGRRLRRRRAARRAVVVSVQRPPDRQGDVRLSHHGPEGPQGDRQRRPRGPQPRRGHVHLGVARGRPDGPLPRHGDERALSPDRVDVSGRSPPISRSTRARRRRRGAACASCPRSSTTSRGSSASTPSRPPARSSTTRRSSATRSRRRHPALRPRARRGADRPRGRPPVVRRLA